MFNYISGTVAHIFGNTVVVDVNGIRIGMINYTYDTRTYTNGRVSLNGIPLSKEHAPLMNTFNYNYLDEFYEKLQGEMDAMYQDGADAIVRGTFFAYAYRNN